MMTVSAPARAMTIFLAYDTKSKKDKRWVEKFRPHLSALIASYSTSTWCESELLPGDLISSFNEGRLNNADLIIALVSADFLAPGRSSELEMKLALARVSTGKARLIPVLLRSCNWKHSLLADYKPLPSNERFISSWSDDDEAFTDVVLGIRQALDELAAQESTPDAPVVYSSVCEPPYPYDDLFTDRESVIDSISAFFASGRPRRTSVLALSGIGGSGKTSIALEYCYLASQTCKDVWWLNASSHTVMSVEVSKLADRFSLPSSVRQDEPQLFDAIKQRLRDLPNWLLVLDQIEDMNLVNLIIPPLSGGRVLLTTRVRDTKRRGTLLPIPSMDPDAGALFLLRRMQILSGQAPLDSAPAKAQREAQALSRATKGSPLALDQAGAYLIEGDRNMSFYLKLYKKQGRQVLSKDKRAENDDREGNDREGVGREEETETQAFPFMQVKDTLHRKLSYLLSFLHPDVIPEALIVNGAQALDEPLQALAADARRLHEVLDKLRSASLIRYQANTALLSMQRTTQERVIETLTGEQQRYWVKQVVRMVNSAFPKVGSDTQALAERYLPQAEHCATLISTYHLRLKEGALLLERLGSFCIRRASYGNAETYLKQALHLYEHSMPTQTLDIAQTLNSLGRLYRRQARYKKAEATHRRALQLREQALGPDHPKTAASLHNLALIYRNLGRYQEAEQLYQRALSIEERTKGSDHPDVADTLNNLGLVYAQQGRYAEADEAYQRALTIYRNTRGDKDTDLAYTLSNLGALAEQEGNNQLAEERYQQALAIRERAYGKEHPEVARSLNKLAGVAMLRNDYEEAEKLYQQAITMSEQISGPKHPDVALTLNDQAFLATEQGQYARALPLYQRALSIYRLVLGAEHPDTASVLNNLGQLFRELGDLKRADKYLRRALAIREKVLASTHPDIAQSRSNLAELLADQHPDAEG